jgi:hypothetical protein
MWVCELEANNARLMTWKRIQYTEERGGEESENASQPGVAVQGEV